MTNPIIPSRDVCPTCGHRQSDDESNFRLGFTAGTKAQREADIAEWKEYQGDWTEDPPSIVPPPPQGTY